MWRYTALRRSLSTVSVADGLLYVADSDLGVHVLDATDPAAPVYLGTCDTPGSVEGLVATDGWLQTSETPATELARRLAGEPLAAIVYTDIATDGMLAGPNVEAMAEMQRAVGIEVVASGGVTTREDVARLVRHAVDPGFHSQQRRQHPVAGEQPSDN